MTSIKLGLALANNWNESDAYIFPTRVEQIEGCKGVNDFETLYQYALQKLECYKGKEVDLYITSGLSSELLEVIKAGIQLDIKFHMYYWNKENNEYVKGEFEWKPQQKQENSSVKMLAVCDRHEALSRLEHIFGKEIEEKKFFDFEWMKEEVRKVLEKYQGYHLNLYPTGLTQTYISVLNVAGELGMSVTMMIHDTRKKKYLAVEMDS